jgi:RND family efflux transporter MFP subunit
MDIPRPLRAFVILLMAAAAASCSGGGAGGDDARPTDDASLLSARDLATVARADLATGVPVQGTLAPAVEVNIVAPFPELLEAVLVKEGEAVRRGQVLARFRTTAIGPAAASAEAHRLAAAADYQRMKNLLEEGAVAPRDVENAEAQLKAAEAADALARKHLDEAVVTAPLDGVVAHRFVQGGDRVGDGDPLFRLVNTDELEFEASVPTGALGSVHPGAPVALTISGITGFLVEGRIARVNATVDPATRQVKVYVAVPNHDHRLAGDMFATGRIVREEAKGVLALPSPAVRTEAGGTPFAWVVTKGRIEKRALTIGLRDELRELVEVKGGVADGDSVIVSPVEGLRPGRVVEIMG